MRRSHFESGLAGLPKHVHANIARTVKIGTVGDIDQEIDFWKSQLAETRIKKVQAYSKKQEHDAVEELAAIRARIRNLQAKRRRRMTGPRKLRKKSSRL